MRTSRIVVGLIAVSACTSKTERPADKAPEAQPAAPAPMVKKPVDTRPLPPLASDPGGATGKPVHGVGFGGLGIDAPRGIVADGGDAYVAGYFDGELDAGALGKHVALIEDGAKKPAADAYVAKIGADGKLAWLHTFGAKRDDVATSIAIKGDHVVVAGNFLDEVAFGPFKKKSAGSDDAFVVALSKSGEVQWAWNFGGIDSDGANCIAATPDGGWVVGGSFSMTGQFGMTTSFKSRGGTDAMLLKLSAGGELEWAKQFGGAYADSISHLAVDAQGNIVIQGQFKDVADWGGEKLKAGGGSDNDVVLAKYDLNGDHVWSKRFGNAFNDVAGGVTVDPAGNITMVGSFDKSISFAEGADYQSGGESDVFIARFAPTGTFEWARTYGSDREDVGFGVAADGFGNTVTTGWFQGAVEFGKGMLTSKGNKDVFVLKLDAKGALVWAQGFGDKDHDQGRAITTDGAGATYVAGIYRFRLGIVSPALESTRAEGDRIPKPDTFVIKLDR